MQTQKSPKEKTAVHWHTSCDPDTKYFISTNQWVCLTGDKLGWRVWGATEWWRGGRVREGGGLWLEASLKRWNRSMSQGRALMAREISEQIAWRRLVSMTKSKPGVCYRRLIAYARFTLSFCHKSPRSATFPQLCVITAGRWPQRHRGLATL